MDLEPHDTKLGGHQGLVKRFGNDGTVSLVSCMQAGQRAVAGAFFFDHRLQGDRGSRFKPNIVQRLKRLAIGNDAGFHVASAAAVNPVILDMRGEGAMAPLFGRSCRHHIHMAIQDQAASGRVFRAMQANNVFTPVITINHGWRKARLIA